MTDKTIEYANTIKREIIERYAKQGFTGSVTFEINFSQGGITCVVRTERSKA